MALADRIEGPDSDTVTFGSYNSTGLDIAKVMWTKDIIEELNIDFFGLQEHLKSNKSTQKYFDVHFSDKWCFVVPAFRAPGQLTGRCAGGIAQFSNKIVKMKIDRIQKGCRIQAQVLHMKNGKILWINSYMPCDPGPADAAWDDTDLITCLGQVESLLTSTTYDENVWGKDLNWSMERNTRFARIMSSFIARLR